MNLLEKLELRMFPFKKADDKCRDCQNPIGEKNVRIANISRPMTVLTLRSFLFGVPIWYTLNYVMCHLTGLHFEHDFLVYTAIVAAPLLAYGFKKAHETDKLIEAAGLSQEVKH